jgi:hypothetical protein
MEKALNPAKPESVKVVAAPTPGYTNIPPPDDNMIVPCS